MVGESEFNLRRKPICPTLKELKGLQEYLGKVVRIKAVSHFKLLVFVNIYKTANATILGCKIDLILTSSCKALHQSGVVRLLVRN